MSSAPSNDHTSITNFSCTYTAITHRFHSKEDFARFFKDLQAHNLCQSKSEDFFVIKHEFHQLRNRMQGNHSSEEIKRFYEEYLTPSEEATRFVMTYCLFRKDEHRREMLQKLGIPAAFARASSANAAGRSSASTSLT